MCNVSWGVLGYHGVSWGNKTDREWLVHFTGLDKQKFSELNFKYFLTSEKD